MSETTELPVVRVDDVSKRFVLHHDKSLKERALNFGRRRKRRDDFWALNDVSADIQLGHTVGLIGHNGSGKSTLLKIIGGIIEPTKGTVYRRGRMAALLELGAGFHPDLSGRENVYLNAAILGMSRAETDEVFDSIVEFSGVETFIDNQVKFYSSGMYVRLAFAVAVHSNPDLLLVDEVLAVGDEPFQAKCMTKIREFQEEGRTIVLVSHSMEQVADICDQVIVLENGRMLHNGDVGEGIDILRQSFEQSRVRRLQDGLSDDVVPSKEVEIEYADILVDGQRVGRSVPVGSTMSIRAGVTVREPGPWIAGFTIETPLQQAVYRLNSEGMGMELPAQPGRYVLEFVLKDVNFGGGQYVLSFGAERPTRDRLDILKPAAQFTVPNDDHGAGFVQFQASGSVDTLAVEGSTSSS